MFWNKLQRVWAINKNEEKEKRESKFGQQFSLNGWFGMTEVIPVRENRETELKNAYI